MHQEALYCTAAIRCTEYCLAVNEDASGLLLVAPCFEIGLVRLCQVHIAASLDHQGDELIAHLFGLHIRGGKARPPLKRGLVVDEDRLRTEYEPVRVWGEVRDRPRRGASNPDKRVGDVSRSCGTGEYRYKNQGTPQLHKSTHSPSGPVRQAA